MSRVIDPPIQCRTTDHSDEIAELREIAQQIRNALAMTGTRPSDDMALRIAAIQCAAALLEVHDATGISLDDWAPGPKDLVNTVLEQYELGQLLENHV